MLAFISMYFVQNLHQVKKEKKNKVTGFFADIGVPCMTVKNYDFFYYY